MNRKRSLSASTTKASSSSNFSGHEEALHQIELLHFVLPKIKASRRRMPVVRLDENTTDTTDLSLLTFLTCQSLPPSLQIKTNSSGKKGPSAQIETQLESCATDISYFCASQGLVSLPSEKNEDSFEDYFEELESGLEGTLCFMIERLLETLSPASLTVMGIKDKFHYTETHLIRTVGTVKVVLREQGFRVQNNVVVGRTSVDQGFPSSA